MFKEEKTKFARSNESKKKKSRKPGSKEETSWNVAEHPTVGLKEGSNRKKKSGDKSSDRGSNQKESPRSSDRAKKGSHRSGRKKGQAAAVSKKKKHSKHKSNSDDHLSPAKHVSPLPAKKSDGDSHIMAVVPKKPSSKGKSSDEKSKPERKKSQMEITSPGEREMEFSAMMPPKSMILAAKDSGTAVSRCSGVEQNKKGKKQAAADWATGVLAKGVEGIIEEYKAIKKEVPPEEYKQFTAHEDHNRYDNTVCLDCSRVKLPIEDDYIHANYVGALENKPNQFICTQGPLENTAERFWRMVLAEEVQMIAMLCETMERGEDKCFQYFPKNVGETLNFGDVSVTNIEQTEFDPAKPVVVTNTVFVLELEDKKVAVHHLHWRSWPDHGVPTNFTAPMRLLSRFRSSEKPIIVHCSAGIGRTGTLVLIGLAQGALLHEKFLGMQDMLIKIREQRAGAVQNEHQYLYAHRVLIEYLVDKNIVEKNEVLEKFNKEYDEKMTKKRRPAGDKAEKSK